MDRVTLQSVSAARRGTQRPMLTTASLVAAIILLHASVVQAAGGTATDMGSLPLRDQVRMMTSEPADIGRADSTDTGPKTTQGRAPIDKGQFGRAGNLRYGAGYESRMGAQPRRE